MVSGSLKKNKKKTNNLIDYRSIMPTSMLDKYSALLQNGAEISR